MIVSSDSRSESTKPSQVVVSSSHLYLGTPSLAAFIPRHALGHTASTRNVLLPIKLVLSVLAFAQILFSVVERVVIAMIDYYTISVREAKNFSLYSHTGLKFPYIQGAVDIETSGGRIPICAPIELRKSLEVLGIDNGVLPLRQWNQLVGWVKRLSDGVSLHAEFPHRLTSSKMVQLSRYFNMVGA